MQNPFQFNSPGLDGMVRRWVQVTPDDANDNVNGGNSIGVAIYVENAGDVAFHDLDGTVCTMPLPANGSLPTSVRRVLVTGTGAVGRIYVALV